MSDLSISNRTENTDHFEESNPKFSVQDQERRRIARELHDSLGQKVAVLKMNLDRLKRLNAEPAALVSESVALIEMISTEIRTISYLLHPPLLDVLGLEGALRELMNGFSQRCGIDARLEMDNVPRLPVEMQTSIYRIIQECLTNIHRHSGSPTARVRFEKRIGEIEITVQDEGRGFPVEKRANGAGVGLAGMHERASELGGTLEINSNGNGTTVIARLPLSNEAWRASG